MYRSVRVLLTVRTFPYKGERKRTVEATVVNMHQRCLRIRNNLIVFRWNIVMITRLLKLSPVYAASLVSRLRYAQQFIAIALCTAYNSPFAHWIPLSVMSFQRIYTCREYFAWQCTRCSEDLFRVLQIKISCYHVCKKTQ